MSEVFVMNLLVFLLEANVCFALFALSYLLFLRPLTHYSWMRTFILLVPAVAIIIGLINIDVEQLVTVTTSPVNASLNTLFPFGDIAPQEAISDVVTSAATSILWTEVVVVLLLLGSLLTLAIIGLQWLRLSLSLRSSAPIPSNPGVYISDRFQTAFAFRSKIYVPSSFLELADDELAKVIAHEQKHLLHHHGLDFLWMGVLRSLFWFNPLYWILQKELRQIHEFQVDQHFLDQEQQDAYAQLLIKLGQPEKASMVVQAFAQSSMKTRIEKFYQPKSQAMKKSLFLLTIPLSAMLFYAFSIHPIQRAVTAPVEVDHTDAKPFILPLPAESVTRVQPFGPRKNPLDAKREIHKGIDFAAPMGTKIFAAADGEVARIQESGDGYGNAVILVHKNGLKTMYAHLKNSTVSVGQSVKQGDVIGTCGSTGRSTGPHLHFEVRKGEESLDPEPFMALQDISTAYQNVKIDRSELLVVIDPGHGGKDPGSGPEDLQEKELAMQYAGHLVAELMERGIKVKLTREGDEFVSLDQRVAMTAGKEVLFISLHFNEAESHDARGVEVFVPDGNDQRAIKSKKYAQAFGSLLFENQVTSRGMKAANFTVLKNAESPSVVIELGFLSSPADIELIMSKEYREKLAGLMADGVENYIQ